MILFEVKTPLGFTVRTTPDYWKKIVMKHPDMEEHLQDVIHSLQYPDEIRKSRQDEYVFLFYSALDEHWLSVVVKQQNKNGFLITCYRTDKIKEGEIVWHK